MFLFRRCSLRFFSTSSGVSAVLASSVFKPFGFISLPLKWSASTAHSLETLIQSVGSFHKLSVNEDPTWNSITSFSLRFCVLTLHSIPLHGERGHGTACRDRRPAHRLAGILCSPLCMASLRCFHFLKCCLKSCVLRLLDLLFLLFLLPPHPLGP